MWINKRERSQSVRRLTQSVSQIDTCTVDESSDNSAAPSPTNQPITLPTYMYMHMYCTCACTPRSRAHASGTRRRHREPSKADTDVTRPRKQRRQSKAPHQSSSTTTTNQRKATPTTACRVGVPNRRWAGRVGAREGAGRGQGSMRGAEGHPQLTTQSQRAPSRALRGEDALALDRPERAQPRQPEPRRVVGQVLPRCEHGREPRRLCGHPALNRCGLFLCVDRVTRDTITALRAGPLSHELRR